MTPLDISEEILAYAHLKELKDEAAAVAKDREREFKAHQAHCLERMEAEGIEGLKAYGASFSPVNKDYATVQDRSAFVEWAKENDSELIEFKERGEQLNALVRARLDNGEPLPDGIGFYTRSYISMRAS